MPPPWEVSYPSLSRTETWSKCHGLPLAVLGTVTLLCWGPCVRAVFLAAPHAGSLTCSTTLTSRGREGSPAATKHPFPAVLSIPSPWSQTSLPRSLLASLPWVPEHLIPVVPCCPSLQSHAAHPCSLMLPMCRNAPGMESSIASSSLPTLGAVVPLPHPKRFQKRGGACSYHLGTRTSAPRISHPCSTPGERSPGAATCLLLAPSSAHVPEPPLPSPPGPPGCSPWTLQAVSRFGEASLHSERQASFGW